ncbi:MAG: Gfo/Idh/MocA family oxidoreductase [Candidatus Micrarchaeia archaeon]
MNIFVIGCGSIGRRHIKNLISLGYSPIGIDPFQEYREYVEKEFKVKTYEDIDIAMQKMVPDIALICTPPSSHVELGKKLALKKVHLFIEKPVSNKLDEIDELKEIAKKNNVKTMVGYNWRFSRSLKRVKEVLDSGILGKMIYAKILFGQYLPDWRPWQDYRKSYSAIKEMGGGIILDASHEIDYANWLFGKLELISSACGKLSNLEINVEDTVEMLLKNDKGALVNIHLDFVRRDKKRYCEIVCESGTIYCDLLEGTIRIYDCNKKNWKEEKINEMIDEMYVEEIKYFIDCCLNKMENNISTIDEAKHVLKIALKAREMCEV